MVVSGVQDLGYGYVSPSQFDHLLLSGNLLFMFFVHLKELTFNEYFFLENRQF